MLAASNLRMWIALATLLPALGCATIVSGPRSKVAIKCEQPNACVVIRDRNGQEVSASQAPTEVKLDRSVTWFKPANYTATIQAPGYQPQQVEIKYTLNPWYFGNVALLSVGGLVIDGASGAMWKPKESTISVVLQPEASYGMAVNGPMVAGQYAPNGVMQSGSVPVMPAAIPYSTPGSPVQQVGYAAPH